MITLENDSGLGDGVYPEIENTLLDDTEIYGDSGYRLNPYIPTFSEVIFF